MAKSTIRDILPPEGRRPKRPAVVSEIRRPSHEEEDSFRPDTPHMRVPRRNRPSILYIGFAVILLIALGFLAMSMVLSGAQVTIYPKHERLVVDGTFSATPSFEEGTGLSYETVELSLTKTGTVPATGREQVERKASGNIIVYNNYNTIKQRLIRNTRFETPDGQIYRIDKSVVVPGRTRVAGVTTPGSVEVTVYADEPGESYNRGLTDFVIPGFKGQPQFEHFYARSKTPMTGGFVGEQLVVEDSLLASTKQNLRETIESSLRLDIAKQTPEGFVFFDNSLFVEFESLPIGEKGTDAVVTEKGTLHGILFKSTEFASHLAKNTLGSYDGSPVDILQLEALTLIPQQSKEGVNSWEASPFSFSLTGNVEIVWLYDEEQLKGDLAGRAKEAIYTILSGYPGIDRAEVIVRPFWRKGFPDDVEEISVKEIIEE